MLVPLFFEKAPSGVLYEAAQLAEGSLNGRRFIILASPQGLLYRQLDHRGVFLIPWSELAKSMDESIDTDDDGWAPMEKAAVSVNRVTGVAVTPEEAGADEVWGNNLYTVHVRRGERMVHLSIHRHDRAPARDWRHLYRIKNEIVGPEFEGVELYPAESRLVDTSNQFHVWVPTDEFGGPVTIPFGFQERLVMGPEELTSNSRLDGQVQRQRIRPDEGW